jgi:hypothetical protein
MDTAHPLSKRLSLCVELRYPGFEKQYGIRDPKVKAYAFEPMDGRVWYIEFRQRIFNAQVDHMFLPVYRMCDGEFIFSLGYHPSDRSPLWYLSPIRIARRIRKRLMKGSHLSGSKEYGYENYSVEELEKARDIFVKRLRLVAEKGILALCLHDTPLSKPFVPAILNWFDRNQIPVHRQNYYHFYGLYALMHGPDRFSLLRDRRILVVTGLNPEKQQGIEAGLQRVGVAGVQFLPVSLNKAMLDVLDLSSVQLPVDVVLVGAGVGSVNVLMQLEPLQTVCLDVGFALSTLVNPDLRWNRPFCVPDDEFDLKKVRWLK